MRWQVSSMGKYYSNNKITSLHSLPNCWMKSQLVITYFNLQNVFLSRFRANKIKNSNFQLLYLFSLTQKAQAEHRTCISILKLMHSPEATINSNCKLDRSSWWRAKLSFSDCARVTQKINFNAMHRARVVEMGDMIPRITLKGTFIELAIVSELFFIRQASSSNRESFD